MIKQVECVYDKARVTQAWRCACVFVYVCVCVCVCLCVCCQEVGGLCRLCESVLNVLYKSLCILAFSVPVM